MTVYAITDTKKGEQGLRLLIFRLPANGYQTSNYVIINRLGHSVNSEPVKRLPLVARLPLAFYIVPHAGWNYSDAVFIASQTTR